MTVPAALASVGLTCCQRPLARCKRPVSFRRYPKHTTVRAIAPGLSQASNGGTASDHKPDVKDGSSPSPGGSNQASPLPPLLPPPGLLEKAAEVGAAKANLPLAKTFVLSILGGVFLSVGGTLAMSVGPACPGMLETNPGLLKMLTGLNGLPFGVFLSLVCGAEVFSGNTAVVTTAVLEGKATLKQLAQNWTVSYLGNLVGSLLMVAMISGCATFPLEAPNVLQMVGPKVALTFNQAFLRGIMANWMVCLATWMAIGANSLASKAIGIYLAISAFVAIGFEHAIANMFLIPLAIVLDHPITWADFVIKNLIPVTLGNIIGGAVMVAVAYSFCYGQLGKSQVA